MNYSPLEDLFDERVIDQLEKEGLTINWRYGYRLANRYEVKRVHAGGFGVVWIVEDQMQDGKRYAAKAPRAYFRKFTDPEERERRQILANMFLNECKIWVDLGKHRHIVQAEFLEKIEGVPIVMSEFIEGGDLEHVLEERRLDIATILDYAIQFCLGMEYAKEQGVAVHRDIKPGNIMVTKDNVAKINDFGLAKAIEAIEPIVVKEELEAPSEVGLVAVSRGAGTPPYMAPEQFPEELLERCGCQATPITTRSDIFSFGLVLYEMVTGRPAFAIIVPDYEEIFNKANKVWTQLPPELQHWSPSQISCLLRWHSLTPKLIACSECLDDIITKCLKIDPDERYESFSELKGELFKLYQQVTGKGYEVIEEPVYKPSWRGMGKTYWILGREEEAFAAYDKALEENPGDTTAWLEKGLSLAEVGKLGEFRSCLETTAYLMPSKEKQVETYEKRTMYATGVLHRDLRLLQELASECAIPDTTLKTLQNQLSEHLDDPFRERDPEVVRLQWELRHGKKYGRSVAAFTLRDLGDRSSVPTLIEALRDNEKDVRAHVAEALGELGDSSAVPALIKAIGDEHEKVREAIAQALGKVGDNLALPALIEALRDQDKHVRWAAAKALGELGDNSAVPALIKAIFYDQEIVVREKATEALWELSDPSAVPIVTKALGDMEWDRCGIAIEEWGQIFNSQTLPVLINALAAQRRYIRCCAAWALKQLEGSTAPALIEALGQNHNPYIHWKAAQALALMGGSLAVPALIKALDDGEEFVRRESARGLGEFGDPSAVPALIKALGDDDMWVREAAAIALRQLGDSSAVPALIKALGDEHEKVREAAAKALGELGDSSVVPALIKALGDEHADTHREAAWALGKLGDKSATPALIEFLGDKGRPGRGSAAWSLGQLEDRSAIQALVRALGDEDADMHRIAAWALGKLGDKSVVPALMEALADGDKFVREDVTKALGEVGDSSAVPALIKALGDEHEKVREAAAEALGKVGDKSALPALIEALRSLDNAFGRVHRAIAEALADIGGSSSVLMLLEMLKDPRFFQGWSALRIMCSKYSGGQRMQERLKEYSALEWNKKAVELAAQGRYREALESFGKAIEIDPDWEEPEKGKKECLGKLD